jgi:hypothetical protein
VATHHLDSEVDEGGVPFALRVLLVLLVQRRLWLLRRDGLAGPPPLSPLVVCGEVLGYTEPHQPFQRRLLDADQNTSAQVLAEE